MIAGTSFAEINEFNIYNENGGITTMLNLADSSRADLRFGLDAQGEIYVLSKQNGKIWKITEAKGLNVSQYEQNSKLQMYPNPVDEILTIKLPTFTSNNLIVTIFNTLGQEVIKLNTNPNSDTIGISMLQFPKGIYIATTVVEGTTYRNTIIKK